jgi:predicted RNA binding protein YcfA (HicA-like mRNA interferase family)
VSRWPSCRARRVLAALLRNGWSIKRTSGSHRTLQRSGWPDYVWSFHDGEEIGPVMLVRIARKTGLRPGERVALIAVRHPDPKRWDLERLAKSGTEEDRALAEQGLAEWTDALDRED